MLAELAFYDCHEDWHHHEIFVLAKLCELPVFDGLASCGHISSAVMALPPALRAAWPPRTAAHVGRCCVASVAAEDDWYSTSVFAYLLSPAFLLNVASKPEYVAALEADAGLGGGVEAIEIHQRCRGSPVHGSLMKNLQSFRRV